MEVDEAIRVERKQTRWKGSKRGNKGGEGRGGEVK